VSSLTDFALVSAQPSGGIQTEFLTLVNAERASLGKAPLVANSQLESAAYLHSKDMGDKDFFSHTSLDGRTFSQRISAEGYRYLAAAENIAMASGDPSASKVFDMWKNSSGHYTNMIGDYADAGLGVYSVNGKTYYTLDLGKSSLISTPKPTVTSTPAHSSANSNPSSTPMIPEVSSLFLLSLMLLLILVILSIKLKK
jgi:hypothetical protein